MILGKWFTLLILLLAFYLRIDDVGNWSVWWDEAFSVWIAQISLVEGTLRTARDIHPPPVLLAPPSVDTSDGQQRVYHSLAVGFAGLVTAALVWSLTLRLSGRKIAAALALLLITLSPFHIHWSQETRMYALAAMFAALAAYACWRGWTGLLILGGIGASLSHYLGAIPVVIIVLHRLIHWREVRHGRRQFVVAITVIVVVCLLWLAIAFGMIRSDRGPATYDLQHAFQLMATLFAVGSSSNLNVYIPSVVLITSVYCLGLALNWRDNRRATLLLVAGCFAPPIILAAISLPFVPFYVPSLQERYFIIFAPLVYAGFGTGLAAIMRRRRLRAAGMVVCAGLLVMNGVLAAEKREARYFRDDFRMMMAAVATLTTADDKVFFTSGGRKPLVYYHLDRAGYDVPKNVYAEPENVTGIPRSSNDVPSMMQRVFARIDRFWLIEIEAHLDEPLGARTNWINMNYHRIHHIPVGWNGISFYSKNVNDAAPESEVIIPPVVTEARPADQVRIGVPAGTTVDLVHSGQTVDTHHAETWTLLQFDVYSFYFNGQYALRLRGEEASYPFTVTHSQEFPGVAA